MTKNTAATKTVDQRGSNHDATGKYTAKENSAAACAPLTGTESDSHDEMSAALAGEYLAGGPSDVTSDCWSTVQALNRSGLGKPEVSVIGDGDADFIFTTESRFGDIETSRVRLNEHGRVVGAGHGEYWEDQSDYAEETFLKTLKDHENLAWDEYERTYTAVDSPGGLSVAAAHKPDMTKNTAATKTVDQHGANHDATGQYTAKENTAPDSSLEPQTGPTESEIETSIRDAIDSFEKAIESESGDADIDAAYEMRDVLESALKRIKELEQESNSRVGIRWMAGDLEERFPDASPEDVQTIFESDNFRRGVKDVSDEDWQKLEICVENAAGSLGLNLHH